MDGQAKMFCANLSPKSNEALEMISTESGCTKTFVVEKLLESAGRESKKKLKITNTDLMSLLKEKERENKATKKLLSATMKSCEEYKQKNRDLAKELRMERRKNAGSKKSQKAK